MNVTKTAMRTQGFIVGALLVVPIVAAFLMWLADGNQRGGFADAKILSVRYIVSVLVLMALLVPFFWVAKTREPGTPLTWGEAMVGAVYVFFLLFWLYGVLPHEFLNWADSELGWRPDKKIIGPEATWAWWSFWKKIPITIHKQIIRDILAVHIYAVGLGGFIWACAFWNDRAKKAAESTAVEKVSTYGRPLVAPAGKV